MDRKEKGFFQTFYRIKLKGIYVVKKNKNVNVYKL